MRAPTLSLSSLLLVSLLVPYACFVVVRAENYSSSVIRKVTTTQGSSSLRYRSSLPMKQPDANVAETAQDKSKDNKNKAIQERPVNVSSSRFEVRSSFLGTSYPNATFLNPPDPTCAASRTTLVGAVNAAIEIRNKKGELLFHQNLKGFYDSLGNLTFVFDPKVAYDEYEERFVVVALDMVDESINFKGNSTILLAVSKSSSPAKKADWYFQAINSLEYDGDRYLWADYPGLGISPEAVYVTTEAFTFGNFYVGSRLRIISKSSFYAGGPISYSSHNPYKDDLLRITRPAMVRGGPIGNNIGTYLVTYDYFSSNLVVTTVKSPLTSPKFSSKEVALGVQHSTLLFSVEQLGSSRYSIDPGDGRVLDVTWRDNSLWSTNTISPFSGPNADQATAYWVRINTTNFIVMDEGAIGGEDIATGTQTSYASVAVNKYGVAAFGFAAFGRSIYPGAYVVGRHPNDSPGTVSSSFVVHKGVDFFIRTRYESSVSRWGDYSCTAVDPMDESFWVFNEFADKRGYRSNRTIGAGVWTTAWVNFASKKPGKTTPSKKKTGKNPPSGKKAGKNPPINKTTRHPGNKATTKPKGSVSSKAPKKAKKSTGVPNRIKGTPRSNRMLRE